MSVLHNSTATLQYGGPRCWCGLNRKMSDEETCDAFNTNRKGARDTDVGSNFRHREFLAHFIARLCRSSNGLVHDTGTGAVTIASQKGRRPWLEPVGGGDQGLAIGPQFWLIWALSRTLSAVPLAAWTQRNTPVHATRAEDALRSRDRENDDT